MLKKKFYKKFVEKFASDRTHPVFELFAPFFEKIMGEVIVNYGGVKLAVGPYGLFDNYIIRGININPYVTSAFSQYLQDGDVFLDIGANHGVLSLLAARNPNVSVFAFEPSPRELSRLWRNLKINQVNNISVLSYALGMKEEYKELILTDNSNPGMNSLPSIRKQGKMLKCRFASLPSLLTTETLKKSRVCKIDIEGQEMIVLQSIKHYMHLLKKCVFVIEMSPFLLPYTGYKVEDIYQFFQEAGFCHQFGKSDEDYQWEEFFYHPDYSDKLIFKKDLSR